jgi:hypothetical protein
MKQALYYSLRVWLTTIVVAPVIVVFVERYPLRPFKNYFKEYLWTVLGDLIFFAPTMLVFFFVANAIYKASITTMLKKLILIAQATVLFLFSWWALEYFSLHTNTFLESQQNVKVAAYLAAIALGAMFYKLNPVDPKLSVQDQP